MTHVAKEQLPQKATIGFVGDQGGTDWRAGKKHVPTDRAEHRRYQRWLPTVRLRDVSTAAPGITVRCQPA
jgi:hypothetical protein